MASIWFGRKSKNSKTKMSTNLHNKEDIKLSLLVELNSRH